MFNKLKEYKELVAIIVFFLGGFIWLNNQFPTKSDLTAEVETLNCLLEKYMTLTQLQIRGQVLEKQLQNLADRISEMESTRGNVDLSPAMTFEFDRLKSDFEHKRNEYRSNKAEIDKILDELGRNVCRKVTK